MSSLACQEQTKRSIDFGGLLVVVVVVVVVEVVSTHHPLTATLNQLLPYPYYYVSRMRSGEMI